MGKLAGMLDRADLKRRKALGNILDQTDENFKRFQKILKEIQEVDVPAYKRCIEDLENIQPLLAKLYKDLGDISPKRR